MYLSVGIGYQHTKSSGFVPAAGSGGQGWTNEEIPDDAAVLRAITALRRGPSSISNPGGDP